MGQMQLALVALAVVVPAVNVRADLDVRPYLAGGRIVTGGHDDAVDQDVARVRAFGYMFGEDALSPFAITDPGFNAEAGDLAAGGQLRFDVHTSLLYWDGAGSITFGSAPALARLDLEKFLPPSSLLDVTVSPTSGVQEGFSIGTVLGDGHIHQHLTSVLSMADGSVPADGVYAFEVSLVMFGNEGTRSEHFYLVYGNGVEEGTLDEAVGALNVVAVPEAGSLGVLGLGGVMMLRRRRVRGDGGSGFAGAW